MQDEGEPILAAHSGYITRLEYVGVPGVDNYGWIVEITSDEINSRYKTRYAHLECDPRKDCNGDGEVPGIQLNQWVFSGFPIGRCGATGGKYSPHLHFALLENGSSIKPTPISGIDLSDENTGKVYGYCIVSDNRPGPEAIIYMDCIETGLCDQPLDIKPEFVKILLDKAEASDDQKEALAYLVAEKVGFEGGGGDWAFLSKYLSGSPTDTPDPIDPHAGYKHDVGLDYVKISKHNKDKWEHSIEEISTDDIPDMDIRAKLKRKGDVWEDVCVYYYLSPNKTFNPKNDQLLGKECKDLTKKKYADDKEKSVYLEDVDMADFIKEPGTYYIYVDIHYNDGINRSSENDKAEYAKIVVSASTATVTDGTIVWSNSGPVAGMTCTQWKEPADPHSWGDNFLCTTRNEDIRWSSDGPIDGMHCIQISESKDPHFQNNWLCVPQDSPLNFVWSEAGPIQGMYGVKIDEPNDKHGWDNNYLFWTDGGANGQATSGVYYGQYQTVTANTGATSPDVLPASVKLTDASGNVRAIYTPDEAPNLPIISAQIRNIGALPSASEQKFKLKSSATLTGPGYESGLKFGNVQTAISNFGVAGYAENLTFTLPVDAVLNEGQYSVTVSTDETDKLAESNEVNNTSPQVIFWVQNALPDIAVENLTVNSGQTEIEAGSKQDITIGIGNIGGDAHFPVVVQLWYDNNTLLGEELIDPLFAGENITITISNWTVPYEEGSHTFTAMAASKFVSYEVNLKNNNLSQSITVFVTPEEPTCVCLNPMEDLPATGNFDMAAYNISFPDTLIWGSSMHPRVTNCTISGSSPKTRAAWAYARCDGTGFTVFDGDTDDGMDAGECIHEEVYTDENLSRMDRGMYMMYFLSNGITRIPESDYSNNVQCKPFLLK